MAVLRSVLSKADIGPWFYQQAEDLAGQRYIQVGQVSLEQNLLSWFKGICAQANQPIVWQHQGPQVGMHIGVASLGMHAPLQVNAAGAIECQRRGSTKVIWGCAGPVDLGQKAVLRGEAFKGWVCAYRSRWQFSRWGRAGILSVRTQVIASSQRIGPWAEMALPRHACSVLGWRLALTPNGFKDRYTLRVPDHWQVVGKGREIALAELQGASINTKGEGMLWQWQRSSRSPLLLAWPDQPVMALPRIWGALTGGHMPIAAAKEHRQCVAAFVDAYGTGLHFSGAKGIGSPPALSMGVGTGRHAITWGQGDGHWGFSLQVDRYQQQLGHSLSLITPPKAKGFMFSDLGPDGVRQTCVAGHWQRYWQSGSSRMHWQYDTQGAAVFWRAQHIQLDWHGDVNIRCQLNRQSHYQSRLLQTQTDGVKSVNAQVKHWHMAYHVTGQLAHHIGTGRSLWCAPVLKVRYGHKSLAVEQMLNQSVRYSLNSDHLCLKAGCVQHKAVVMRCHGQRLVQSAKHLVLLGTLNLHQP